MPEYDYATPAPSTGEISTLASAEETDFGFNSDQQCALEEGCDGDVPPLDDVFREGFADEHAALVADVAEVTGRAMELQGQVPSPDHAALLDLHINGVLALEDALAAAITTAQAGSAWGEGEEVDVDQEAVDAALALWRRLEVGLDLLREHNGLYAAVLAQDLAGMLEMLSSLAAAIVEAGIERSLDEQAQRTVQARDQYDNAWKVAALSVAKIPADIAVDAAVGAAITAAIPLLLGTATGTLPAVALGLLIAGSASVAWNYVTADWGPDLGTLGESVVSIDNVVDVGADAASIDQVGQGFKAGAQQVGKTTLYLNVLLDVAKTGVAIDGLFEASSAWEAFKLEHAKLMALWDQASLLFGNFVRFAGQMNRAVAMLSDEINLRREAILSLEREFGAAIYDV